MNDSTLRWRKSTRSSSNAGNCVEVADTLTALRDSKNADGPVLAGPVDPLLIAIKAGRLG